MKTIYKTGTKATYLEGNFELVDEGRNWAHPIDFPIIFTAYGKAVRSGNWQRCTAINTPDYVIKHYLNNKVNKSNKLWSICRELENIKWSDVKKNRESVLNLINIGNEELSKLDILGS